MPKIFSDEDRSILYDKMLAVGLELLEHKRYKYISVEEIAQESGVAKGTFYNFFSSKEAYFYQIMQLIKEKNREPLRELPPHANVTEIADCLFVRYTYMKTIYEYFSTDEIKQIVRKLPDGDTANDSEQFAAELFNRIQGCKGDSKVVVTMFHILALASADNSIRSESVYNLAMKQYCNALAEYIVNGEQQ